MRNNKEYNLDLYQALKIVIDGGAVKGDNFRIGIFLKLNNRGQLAIIDANQMYLEDTNVFIKGMSRQKFRELTVMTSKELNY